MQFRTELKPQKSDVQISHEQKILSIGSCFAENIGQLLESHKFNIQLNPFGITYNPGAIARGIEILRHKRLYSQNELFNNEGLWFSLDHHSRFSNPDPEAALDAINAEIASAHERLGNLDLLILTLGTAHVFYHKKEQRIVNNCHKLHSNHFERKLLSVGETVNKLSPELNELQILNPDLKIILTVSPVRHIRDGLVESKRSKATLLVAVHELCTKLNFVHYYPAYEILLDDLRDYRFYDSDLVHPSEEAIGYIWNHFSETFFANKTEKINKEVAQLIKALQHRPFFPGTDKHKAFLKAHLTKAENLKTHHPYLDLKEEIRYFNS